MKNFPYVAVDAAGRTVRGTVRAVDWESARAQLTERGLGACREAAGQRLEPLRSTEALELASMVSELAKAGLPLESGLRAAAEGLASAPVAAALRALAAHLEAGGSLESGIDELGARLPVRFRELLAAGARSGQLAETLDPMLALERKLEDMRRRFWQATAYPLFLLVLFISWLMFVSLWLVPEMQWAGFHSAMDAELFELFGRSQAESTPQDDAVVEVARAAPPLLLASVVALVLGASATMAIGGRALLGRAAFLVPLFGRAWWYCAMVEFVGLLSTYLKRELGLGEALELVGVAARSRATRAACARVARDVRAGAPLSHALAARALFPMTLVYLVEWGQQKGALVDALDTAERMYANRFELQVRLARLILPPIIFLVVAGGALFMAYGMMSHIVSFIHLLS